MAETTPIPPPRYSFAIADSIARFNPRRAGGEATNNQLLAISCMLLLVLFITTTMSTIRSVGSLQRQPTPTFNIVLCGKCPKTTPFTSYTLIPYNTCKFYLCTDCYGGYCKCQLHTI